MVSDIPAIQVVDLRKTYKGGDIQALKGVSFSISEGEIFGLIGPNGAGKTTIIGCLLGLLRPDSGTIGIFGRPPDLLSVRKMTGYVPERAEFEHWMTARQFLLYHHGLSGRSPGLAAIEIAEALEMVGLVTSAWDRRLKTYSRGMLQRLNLAQLIIGKPRLVLLDEPTLGLDPTGVTIVRNIISAMRDRGVTAIINSHHLDEIERLCDRVAFIRQGEIACIENTKSGAIQDYCLLIKWTGNSLNGSTASTAAAAALQSGARLSECHHDWGRFMVKDQQSAANLIRQLVCSGIPVDEVFPEKNRLEQLFSEKGGSN